MLRLLLFILISLLVHLPIDSIAISLSESNKNTCNEVFEKVRNGALLVDVRTKEEFQAGTLSGSINVPFDQIESRLQMFPTDSQKEVVLYCKSGRRSELGKQTLSKLGYNKVINAGSYTELLKCWNSK